MGTAQPPAFSMFVIAAFSRHAEALQWSRQRIESEWGSIAVESPALVFDQTSYYQGTMGEGLRKVFWGLQPPADPKRLVECKLTTNQWEIDYAAASQHAESRPLNVDPGYLTEAKLVLATTKDRDHRIYLADGILAEVTLSYRRGGWQSHPWTYPDYQSPDVQAFLDRCREYLRSERKRG